MPAASCSVSKQGVPAEPGAQHKALLLEEEGQKKPIPGAHSLLRTSQPPQNPAAPSALAACSAFSSCGSLPQLWVKLHHPHPGQRCKVRNLGAEGAHLGVLGSFFPSPKEISWQMQPHGTAGDKTAPRIPAESSAGSRASEPGEDSQAAAEAPAAAKRPPGCCPPRVPLAATALPPAPPVRADSFPALRTSFLPLLLPGTFGHRQLWGRYLSPRLNSKTKLLRPLCSQPKGFRGSAERGTQR